MKKAMYALTGDPITNGHLYVIQEAMSIFDEFIVALGANASKKGSHAFTTDERSHMLKEIAKAQQGNFVPILLRDDDIAVRVAHDMGAKFVVRGVRNVGDFEKEMDLARMNSLLANVQTIFIPTPQHLSHVSSSMVKGLVGLRDWEEIVKPLVPKIVLEHLKLWETRRNS